MVLNPNIEIYPGANYGLSVFLNLLLPLAIIAIAQTIYAVVLIIECIQSQTKTKTEKVLICIGVWFAVMYLFFGVYIYRLVRLTILKKDSIKARKPYNTRRSIDYYAERSVIE